LILRVLLVNTNRMKPAIAPVGLDYLADSLRASGHKPSLLDLCLSDLEANEIKSKVNHFSPEAVGVTIRNTDDCYFASQSFFLPEICEIVDLIHASCSAPIILGGVGYSTAPAAILEYCQADFGIAGEGEVALPRLLTVIHRRSDISSVPNLVYRHEGKFKRNPGFQTDPAGLPERRRLFVDNTEYFRRGGQAGFETKRGCAMQCIYCADPISKGKSVRLLPPQRVVQELRALISQGIDHLHTCDSEFNLPIDHARRVCEAIIAGGLNEKIRWYAYCAPKPFDNKTARLMKRAGCAGINFGVDSACDKVLHNLGRNFTASDLQHLVRLCRRNRISSMFDLLLGGPGETHQTIRRTIDFVRRINPDCVGLSIGLRVYPDTVLARLIQASGDQEKNPNLHGAKRRNPNFLKPVFYIAEGLGESLFDYVHDLVAGDRRFFLPAQRPENSGYNYNENLLLVQAIERGARGAYWDILRKL
jgi:radical SAM superfamily enzyme YgiQ (UPF0313 family)